MTENFLAQLNISHKSMEPMSAHTSFKIGGAADLFVQPKNCDELKAVLSFAKEQSIRTTVIGNGSNLLCSDEGIESMVVSTLAMKDIRLLDDTHIFASAGASLTAVCLVARDNSLSGLEFAYGIPGSVGGALYMNAGAYGGEMKQVVESAESILDGEIIQRQNEELELSYRHSIYTNKNEVITGVVFALEKGDPDEIGEKMDTLMSKRRTSQPLEYPSAGSTFKRPEGYFAAALIDECGLKGLSCGDAEVSQKHAGFVINKGNATCRDVLSLIEKIKEIVLAKKGVLLETEVIYLSRKG